jgi:hypothetical protein
MLQKLRDYLRSARLIWADKFALMAGLLFSFLLLFLWSLAFLAVGSLGAKHMWGSFGIQGVGLEILMVGTIWFILRTIDFSLGWFSRWPFPDLRRREPALPILGI